MCSEQGITPYSEAAISIWKQSRQKLLEKVSASVSAESAQIIVVDDNFELYSMTKPYQRLCR